MPFTTLDKVKNYLPVAVQTALNQPSVFDDVESASAEIISNITGLDIPVDVADSPEWVHYPAAYIIKKIASAFISTKSEELLKEISGDYDIAIGILKKHSNKYDFSDSKSSFAEFAEIEGGKL